MKIKAIAITIMITMILPVCGLAQTIEDISMSIRTPEALVGWFARDFKYRLNVPDQPKTPKEMLDNKEGDCDDFAALASSLLKRMGIISDILIIKFDRINAAHAVCAWKDRNGLYNFISNNKMYNTGKNKIEDAISKFYPDWKSITIADEERKPLKTLDK